MNLFNEIIAFSIWFLRIVRVFFQIRPWTTLAVISASVSGKITRILSFILPLKVILLAGSPGVPRYFPFIDPSDKMGWIIGLSVLAVGSYFLTLILEAVVNRLSMDAGSEIVQGANEMVVLKNQKEAVHGYYVDFCDTCASLLFLAVASLVLLSLNPLLFLFLVALVLGQVVFTARVVNGSDVYPGRIKIYIQEKLSDYLKIFSAIVFLSAFLIILTPFLAGAGGNILVAIVSVVLVRRSLKFMIDVSRNSVKLYRDRHKIDTLVFPEIQYQKMEARENQVMRDLFHKSARQKKTETELGLSVSLSGPVDVQWVDSPIRGIGTFTIVAKNNGNPGRKHFQQQVFMPNSKLLENEDFLFRYIPRKHFKAPELITRFIQGGFECRICEYGTGKPVSPKAWKDFRSDLLQYYWSCRPPETLVKAYCASRMLLHQRLNADLASRVEVAVDTPEEAESFKRFLGLLPRIQAGIESLPLYVYNPEIIRTNVVPADKGRAFVMTWGRWSLEPIGVILPGVFDEKRLIEIVTNIKKSRDDLQDSFGPAQMTCAARCWDLENLIRKGAYKVALHAMDKMSDGREIDHFFPV